MTRLARFLAGAALAALLLSGARASEWNDTDRALMATALALHLVDWGQTLEIIRPGNGVHEANPILGPFPSRGDVNAYFAGTSLLMFVIAHALPEMRRPLLWGYVAVGLLTVTRNHVVFGVRVGF
jgi:hypothetical protein